MILGSFCDGPVNKKKHYELAMLLGLLRDHCVTNKLMKSDTICDIIH